MEIKEKKLPSVEKPWLKYYTKEAINSEIPEKTIYQYLYDVNIDYPNRTAINYFDKKISYEEMIKKIDETANALVRNGVKEGDIVTISAPTLPEVVYLFYALAKIGAVSNMVDPRTSADGLEKYINEVESKWLFLVDVASPKALNVKKNTTAKNIVLLSPADSLPLGLNLGYKAKEFFESINSSKDNKTFKKNECFSFNEFLHNNNEIDVNEESFPFYEKAKPVVIVHTGGTTGTPKGVVLSNDNVNSAAFQCIKAGFDFKREHNWLDIMPPFIAYGVGNGLHLAFVCGSEIVLIPQFDPTKFADLMNKYQPNHMTGVPTHYDYLINSPKLKDKDLSYIIAPVSGGDAMDKDLEIRTNEFLKDHNCEYKICKGYGLSEVNAAVAACNCNESNKLGSVGIPFPHTVISIFDPETNKELSYNEPGEICISGPNTMIGYYNNKKETDNILKVHDDGNTWVHSGDLGYMDEDGCLYVIDRMKRVIVRHDGFKIFPKQIEDVICEHSAVKECKVVGVSDINEAQGKLPKAHIVLKDSFVNGTLRSEEIVESIKEVCNDKLAEYQIPIDYEIENALPLTPIGKVDFMALEAKDEIKIKKDMEKSYTRKLENS